MTGRPAEPVHLTTEELAERWHTTANAIRIKRSRGNAPEALVIGPRKLLWPLAEVEKFERDRLIPA